MIALPTKATHRVLAIRHIAASYFSITTLRRNICCTAYKSQSAYSKNHNDNVHPKISPIYKSNTWKPTINNLVTYISQLPWFSLQQIIYFSISSFSMRDLGKYDNIFQPCDEKAQILQQQKNEFSKSLQGIVTCQVFWFMLRFHQNCIQNLYWVTQNHLVIRIRYSANGL